MYRCPMFFPWKIQPKYVKFCLCILGFLLAVCPARISQAHELQILTEELKPYNYLDESTGNPAGFAVDVVNLLLKQTGIKAANDKIKIYPWARAYKIAQKQKNTLLFTMARTSPRESLFKWVGPIAPRCIWLWKLKEREDIVIRSFEEAKNYSVGGPIGHAATQYIESLHFKVIYAPSPKLVPRCSPVIE